MRKSHWKILSSGGKPCEKGEDLMWINVGGIVV
jgi:hypothetical protein